MGQGAESLVGRLQAARSVGDGRWIARCPAHDDRSPSLSIRELPDGRTLIHCHAGCAPGDVVAAVGLRMGDLFPADPMYHRAKGVVRASETRAYHEAVVEIAAHDVRAGRRLSREDVVTLKAAREWLSRHPATEAWG